MLLQGVLSGVSQYDIIYIYNLLFTDDFFYILLGLLNLNYLDFCGHI